jgi:hypothetical protein
MSKKNRKRYPRKQKYKNLKYQIKEVELARLEKANVPMLTQTEKQYRNHAIKFANWCKEQYGCRTLDECSAHIQDYADFLVVQGRSPSTIHTYLAGICRICGVPLADIQKPIRVVAENTRSRGMKAVDERKDAGREASPRLYDFAVIVGIRRNEYLHLTPDDLVFDDFGHPCVLVRKGKDGKRQLQRILPDELPAIKAVFDNPADAGHLFPKAEINNKIDLHHLRALRAQKMYRYYLDKIENEHGYRAQLINEIRHVWEHDDEARKENGYKAKRWSDMKVTGNYILRGNNRKLAKKHGLPLQYDRLALLAVSIFHLSHWRHDVTVANYLLAV